MGDHYNRGYGGQTDTSQTQRERDDYNRGRSSREQSDRYFQELADLERDRQKPRRSEYTSNDIWSALPALVAAAAFFYVWSYFDNLFFAAVAAVAAWRFAESKLGQGLLRVLLLIVGLGLMWFFLELSKTFR
jgi:hypothetical protein